jgi:glycosyltransferase involved in cell wall biosynthesis
MSIRILQVITSLKVGGAEKLMVDIIPSLRQRGFDVDILIFNGEETPFKEQLRKAGVRIIELSKNGSMYNPFYIIKLRKYLTQYDIIHSHNAPAQYFVAIASIISRYKSILLTTEHSTNNRRRSIKLFHLLDKWMYRRYKEIICVSEMASNILSTYLEDKAHICTIQNGVDTKIFMDAKPYTKQNLCNIPEDCNVVTQVAAFREEKDQQTVIRAMSRLTSSFHLLLVGDGPCKKDCEQLVSELNMQSRVHFLGIRTDVPQIMKTSDIVVMSSHWEGFGLTAVEGMCASKPVVATDVPGLREVVKDAGVLFPHQDYIKLSEILVKLVGDEEYYNEIAYKCFQRASKYDISKTIEAYTRIYDNLIN